MAKPSEDVRFKTNSETAVALGQKISKSTVSSYNGNFKDPINT